MKTTASVLPVSVVIPAYNGARYIAEAIYSVFAQSQLPREVIVVDDASTDSTIHCVEATAATAPIPVKLISLPQNSGGPAQPMNVGIQAARSPLIAVLDQDDVFMPQRIEHQAAVLSAHREIAFVFGHLDVKRELGSPVTGALPEERWNHLRRQMAYHGDFASCDGPQALRVLLNHGNCVGGFPAFTFRRLDWHALGGLDERLAGAVDYDLLCLLCQRGAVAMVPELHYLYRFHDSNLSRSQILCYTDEIETLAKFADCRAWPNAAVQVRQAIGEKLYTLALLLGVSGSRSVARSLLNASLLVGGLRPRSFLRTANYPIKVFRRQRRSCPVPADSDELRWATRSPETVYRVYGRRWWRRWLGHAERWVTTSRAAKPPTSGAPQDRHAA